MSSLQSIILAAGTGSRLLPYTKTTPKCLLEVKGQPILQKTLNDLQQTEIQSVTLVTGHLHQSIEQFIKRRSFSFSLHLVHNPDFQTTNNAYSLGLALQKSADPFILIDGDLLFPPSFLTQLLSPDYENGAVIDTNRKRLTKEAMKILVTPQNNIEHFSKKIPLGEAYGEYIGLARFGKVWTQKLKNSLSQLNPEMREKAYYEDVINPLLNWLPSLKPLSVNDFWMEIDTPEDLKQANKLFFD